jgi:hypothetical protein
MTESKFTPSSPANQRRYFSCRDIARQLDIGVNQVLSHIRAGNLTAVDLRKPGSSRPLFKVSLAELERFERAKVQSPSPVVSHRCRRQNIPNHLG